MAYTSPLFESAMDFDINYIATHKPKLISRDGSIFDSSQYTFKYGPNHNSEKVYCRIMLKRPGAKHNPDFNYGDDGRVFSHAQDQSDLKIYREEVKDMMPTLSKDFFNPLEHTFQVKNFDVDYVLKNMPTLIQRDGKIFSTYTAKPTGASIQPIRIKLDDYSEFGYESDGRFIHYDTPRDLKMLVPRASSLNAPPWSGITASNLCQEVAMPISSQSLSNLANSVDMPSARLTVSRQDVEALTETLKALQQPKPKQSTGTSPMNIDTLNLLAQQSGKSDDLDQYASIPADIRAHVDALKAKQKKQSDKSAAAEIVNVMKAAQAKTDATVLRIRELRAQEEALLENLEAIKRALAYGHETSNYLPAVSLVNPSVLSIKVRETAVVPEDWKAAKAPKKGKKAKK